MAKARLLAPDIEADRIQEEIKNRLKRTIII